MREDMDRVVIERPRVHGVIKYHDIRTHINHNCDLELLDGLPKNEGYRRPFILSGESKEFSDLLGPLRGFLLSRIGKAWDDVYSEIRSRLNPNATTQIHILNHVFQFIHEKTSIGHDGKIYSHHGGFYHGGPRVVGYGDLYVHPTTGLVCKMPDEKRYYTSAYNRAVNNLQNVFGNHWRKTIEGKYHYSNYRDFVISESKKHVRAGFEQELHKINGIWYWAVWSDVPPPFSQHWFDNVAGVNRERLVARSVSDYLTGETFSEGRYRSGKRQTNRRDLRRYRLHND